jgi:hypothetical protein
MTRIAPIPEPQTDFDPYEGYPPTWSDSAKETFAAIEAEHADLDAVSRATLSEACTLLAAADAMQARIDADGVIVVGSQGQPAAHPLISEVRMARVQALSALKALGIARGQSRSSQAGSALASKRWDRAAVVGAGR